MSAGAVVASKVADNKATPYIIGAVALVGIGVTVWGASKVFGGISDFLGSLGLGTKDEEKEQEENNNLLNDYLQNGYSLTYPERTYQSIANNLWRSMDGAGNDPQQVANELYKMNSKVDVLKLVDTFGIKSNDTLAQWLSNDYIISVPFVHDAFVRRPDGSTFSTASMVTLTSVANQVMRDKNIDYVF